MVKRLLRADIKEITEVALLDNAREPVGLLSLADAIPSVAD